MSSLKVKSIALVGASVLSVGCALATAGEAQAIKRVACTDSAYVKIYSNASTCWADRGSASVTLLNTTGAWGGSNSGYVQSSAGRNYFYVSQTSYWSTRTVNAVTLSATNGW